MTKPIKLKRMSELDALRRNMTGEKKAKRAKNDVEPLVVAARGLVQYRKLAGPLNFQLEKADYFINEICIALENLK